MWGGLARESGVSGDINVGCAAVFASKPAPTWIALNLLVLGLGLLQQVSQ
jgi:hypothetical protein